MRSDRYATEPPRQKNSRLLKAILIIIMLLLLMIAASVFYFYRTTEDSLSLSFTGDDISVEFGGEYPAMDYVADSVGDVTPAAELLAADALGEGSMVYTVTKPILGGLLAPAREFTLSYRVTDSTPPLILWSGDGAVLARGTKFDINDVIAYGDNADPEPSVAVDGKVDMGEEGIYPLRVTVTDASGNSTDCRLSLEVADAPPSYSGSAERTKFKDFVKAYKGDGRVFGIDVSAWQEDVDFEAVKASGCSFVIIRAGWSDKGAVTADSCFEQNLKGAREAGLKVGVYLYSYDRSEEEVRASARQLSELLGGSPLDLPVAFDWEDFGHFQTYRMSFKELNDLYDCFADELAESGYDCMLYGSRNYLEKVWEKTDVRPVWLAHYTDKTDYEGPYMIWQASCTGSIKGIKGNVDMDIMYED